MIKNISDLKLSVDALEATVKKLIPQDSDIKSFVDKNEINC